MAFQPPLYEAYRGAPSHYAGRHDGVGRAELASAVSNTGGLGVITALTQQTPDNLWREIDRCRWMTDKPFGVNLTILPSVTPSPYAEYQKAVVESGVKIVRRLKLGLKNTWKHSNRMASLLLISAHRLDMGQIARNSASDKVVEITSATEAVFEDIRPLVSGARGRVALETGNLDAGLIWAGQVQGLIHDVPTCRILSESSQMLAQRYADDSLGCCRPRVSRSEPSW